jgi:hypothetical protein
MNRKSMQCPNHFAADSELNYFNYFSGFGFFMCNVPVLNLLYHNFFLNISFLTLMAVLFLHRQICVSHFFKSRTDVNTGTYIVGILQGLVPVNFLVTPDVEAVACFIFFQYDCLYE